MDTTGDGDGEAAEPVGDEPSIEERERRLETIAEVLEDGDVSLARAKELRDEADGHLEALREELDRGDGELIDVSE